MTVYGHPQYRASGLDCQPCLTESERRICEIIGRYPGAYHPRLLSRCFSMPSKTMWRMIKRLEARGIVRVAPQGPRSLREGGRVFPLYLRECAYQAALTQRVTQRPKRQEPPPMPHTWDGTPETRINPSDTTLAPSETAPEPHPERVSGAFDSPPYHTDLPTSSSSRSEKVSKYPRATTYVACAQEDKTKGREEARAILAWCAEELICGNVGEAPIDREIASRLLTKRRITLADFKTAWAGYTETEWVHEPTFSGCIARFDQWLQAGRELESWERERAARVEHCRRLLAETPQAPAQVFEYTPREEARAHCLELRAMFVKNISGNEVIRI